METKSVCPVCYKEIKANILVGKSVMMFKDCEEHGSFMSTVEVDSDWWLYCKQLDHKYFYMGYLLDITNECNLYCKYCYHKNFGAHKDVYDVIIEIEDNKGYAPFLISGGEPTLHPQLPAILDKLVDDYVILTNGTRLYNEDYFNMLCYHLKIVDKVLPIALSFHPESYGRDFRFLDMCKKLKYKLNDTLWVIDDLSQIDNIMVVLGVYSDVIDSIRIKAATNLGNETKAGKHIFTSEIVSYLKKYYGAEIDLNYTIKNSYAPMLYQGKRVIAVSWYDKYNVDLNDIDCPPYYKAIDGSVNNLVTTCIKNERHYV